MLSASVVWQSFALLAGLTICQTLEPSRIVNGTDSSIKKYPFMVSLRRQRGSHVCGGTVIAPKFVLTAAHCTYGRVAGDFTVQFGVTRINATGSNILHVARIIQHEAYDPKHIENDISLLQVEKAFPINYRNVELVSLPELNFETPQDMAGAPGVLAGWGYNRTFGTVIKHLQEVQLKIYSNAECKALHGSRVIDTNICAGAYGGGMGQCSGDSGGPLLLNGKIQVGIVSWSVKPCAVSPGVLTKVAKYIEWIKRSIY